MFCGRWKSGQRVVVEGVVIEWSAKWSGHRVGFSHLASVGWSYDPRAVAIEVVVGWL